MKNLNWIDETSYSRGERGNVPPRILATKIEGVKIIIHKHIYNPDTWFLTCYGLNIERLDLNANNFETAVGNAKDCILNEIYKFTKLRDKLLEK